MKKTAFLETKKVERDRERKAQHVRRYVIDINKYVDSATKKPSKKCSASQANT
jgi:hypothetical protein